jgi:hypothetical protein
MTRRRRGKILKERGGTTGEEGMQGRIKTPQHHVQGPVEHPSSNRSTRDSPRTHSE